MTADNFDVVVVGNVGIDTNVYLATDQVDFSVEANYTQNIDLIGQAGGYASRAYAALGLKAAILAHVGDDFSGRYIRETLAQDGIETRGLLLDPMGTSRSINFMYAGGQRKNFYDGKGHMDLHYPLDLAAEVFADARLAHFNLPNWGRQLLPLAKEAGAVIACDIQDVTNSEDPYRADFVQFADYLFFSAANCADPEPLIRRFLAVNPRLVVISGMGAKGCVLGSAEGIHYYPPVDLGLALVDTNGAGDALAVGFLFGRLIENRSLEDSIRCGQISARHKCAQRATSGCMISKELLHRHLSNPG